MLAMNADEDNRNSVSRRQVLLGTGASLTALALGNQPANAVATASVAPIAEASALYVDFRSSTAQRFGTASNFEDAVPIGGNVLNPATTNRFAPMLPFIGASVPTNRLPSGLEWNTVAAPKTLLSTTNRGIVFRAHTSQGSPKYFGGVRTSSDILNPGESALLSFRADLSNISGSSWATICVTLIRMSDQRTTVEATAYTLQEDPDALVTVRLKAPEGGEGRYRVVWIVKAGTPGDGQAVTVSIKDAMLIREAESPRIGARYALPPYFEDELEQHDVVLQPNAETGMYYVLVQTEEFGWGVETVDIQSRTSAINIQSLFGPSAALTILQVYVIEFSAWQNGWLSTLSPVAKLLPLRFWNLGVDAGGPRPESPNRLGRLVGSPGSVSSVREDITRNIPWLTAPESTWAAAFNPDRLSHSVFTTTNQKYIGDSGINSSYRSEVVPYSAVEFEKDIWLSLSFQISSQISSSSATLFQYRYTKNTTGDSSVLAPDLSLEQLSRGRLYLYYRSDRGIPQLSGSGSITSNFVGPIQFVQDQYHSLVLRVRFSKTGGGHIAFWFDGQRLMDDAVPVGYNRNVGPQFRFGSYKYASESHKVSFMNLEHGLSDLSSRIEYPLAT